MRWRITEVTEDVDDPTTDAGSERREETQSREVPTRGYGG